MQWISGIVSLCSMYTRPSLAVYLKRDDVRDALIHPAELTLAQLPTGARIGTSSVRRRA